jgi:hypothetical protein
MEDKPFIERAKSYGKSIHSRGFINHRASENVIKLRTLSCHGDDEIEPCPKRQKSTKHDGRFICGGCGCGDKKRNFLNRINEEEYTKIDYPYVECPLQMPGFSNYYKAKKVQNRKIRVEQRVKLKYNIDTDIV